MSGDGREVAHPTYSVQAVSRSSLIVKRELIFQAPNLSQKTSQTNQTSQTNPSILRL